MQSQVQHQAASRFIQLVKSAISRVVSIVVAVAIIALAFGASIGYAVSSGRTLTFTQTQSPSTETIAHYSTTTTTVTTTANKTYPVLTITEVNTEVVFYLPTCINGNVTYTQDLAGGSSTVSYIYPSNPPNTPVVSVTTTFIFTNSNQTQSESMSC